MKNIYKKISISVDKDIDLLLEKNKVNKSKLINFLIDNFFNKKNEFKNFIKK